MADPKIRLHQVLTSDELHRGHGGVLKGPAELLHGQPRGLFGSPEDLALGSAKREKAWLDPPPPLRPAAGLLPGAVVEHMPGEPGRGAAPAVRVFEGNQVAAPAAAVVAPGGGE